ncbi:MAG: hypothetical protein ACRDG6_01370 [Candidatus Limnocylindria bacterium]
MESFIAAGVGQQIFAILANYSEWSERVKRAAQRARARIETFYGEPL